MVELSAEEKELIVFGLQMRKNYIQTGDAFMSAVDAKNLKQEKKIKILGDDQIELIHKLNLLIKKIENSYGYIIITR
jgi:hypothetical protein